MPNRILKESIKTSVQVDALSWFEEVVFYRLIVTADDYGCLDGRIILLKNELFPTKDNVTKKAIEDAIAKLASVGLLCRYTVNGTPYLCFPTWEGHQRIRNKRRKYPAPPMDVICQSIDRQLTVNCQSNVSQLSATCQSESESESESEIESESNMSLNKTKKDSACAPAREQIPGLDGGKDGYGRKEFESDLSVLSKRLAAAVVEWMKYKKQKRQPYQPKGIKKLITQVKNYADNYGEDAMIRVISNSMANGYQGITFDAVRKEAGGGLPDKRREKHDYEADMEDAV